MARKLRMSDDCSFRAQVRPRLAEKAPINRKALVTRTMAATRRAISTGMGHKAFESLALEGLALCQTLVPTRREKAPPEGGAFPRVVIVLLLPRFSIRPGQ